jgi:hypothetical protein
MPPASTIQFVDRYASFIDLLLAGSETRLKRDYTRSESRRCRRIPCLLADLGNNTGLKIVQSVGPCIILTRRRKTPRGHKRGGRRCPRRGQAALRSHLDSIVLIGRTTSHERRFNLRSIIRKVSFGTMKPTSRSQWKGGFGADSGPSRGEPCRPGLRPIEASTDATRNVRFTSLRDGRSNVSNPLKSSHSPRDGEFVKTTYARPPATHWLELASLGQ